MHALFRIIYAAHANGTHHKLALDGLQSLRGANADRWIRLFLKHTEVFLDGSKAPDTQFKDFKNHVLHVRDDYWGGAPEQATVWYDKTVAAFNEQRWADGVFAAGVLSHYYTDPIHPFHTAQTEAEGSIHAAVEWSINRSYNDLRRLGEELYPTLDVEIADGRDWLKVMVCRGAEFSNQHYEKLIAHYDIHRGVVDPPTGLDDIARRVVAELLIYAATGYARILDRALADSGSYPVDVPLAMDTVRAIIKIPAKTLLKRVSNAQDRALVEAMYDELKATGGVEKTLRDDDRSVRDSYVAEVLAPRLAGRPTRRAQRAAGATSALRSVPELPTPLTAAVAPPQLSELGRSLADRLAATQPFSALPPMPRFVADTAGTQRGYLGAMDDLDAAPSIGPKMAQRLATLGVMTVQDFLNQEAAGLSARLADRRITATMLAEWQAQARLGMQIPSLRGGHAQLLTGAGYLTASAVADTDPVQLCADILKFAASEAGKRILCDGNPPDIERIKAWVDAAVQAQAA